MAYVRVDDHLHAHRKTLRAGVAPMGLWVLAASWSMGERTDGWVPDYVARRLDPDVAEHAAALVAAGLWHEDEKDGDQGWQFHQWDEHQHTTAYIEERNRRNANRMRHQRAQERAAQASDLQKRRVRAHASDTAETVREPQPNPTQIKTPAADAASDPDFRSFWSAYPRKVGKQAAAKAYAKARKSTDAEPIATGLSNAVAVWQSSRTEERFIPHPSTWLNEARWGDEHPTLTPDAPQAPTACQCDQGDPHPQHRWADARNRYWCAGVGA